jgi:hypothetical protein
MALRRSDESNDFRAQDNPSHTAMTTSPANVSAIKYAVMSFSFLNQSCGMIACAIISGTNLISIKWRPACGRGLAPRRVPARSRVPANEGGEAVFPRERSDARSEISAQHYKVRTATRLRRSGDAGEDVAP